MDIYTKKSRWKLYMFLSALIIVVLSLIYTNSVASRLAEQEQQRAKRWATAISELNRNIEDTLFAEVNLEFLSNFVIENKTIPVILTNEKGDILFSKNLDEDKIEKDTAYLIRQKEIMKNTHDSIPIVTSFYENYVFYKNSQLYTILTYFPYFQMLLISLFLLVGYVGFSSARRAEQNQVWVGMAKETAHQLGTPISGIVAWIEHLKADAEADNNEYQMEVLKEFRRDVRRLELIAERFSKIGSIPEMTSTDLEGTLTNSLDYMKRRAPKRISFGYFNEDNAPINANINPPLFEWVIENLLKNALDAMDGTGSISIHTLEDDDFVYVDIQDTGSGIPQNKFKTVFMPGFSTKKRGWGLGLSLTKRIIENYHNGKIFVKESEVGKGTTFRIQLPKS